ncbi:hypothetical protein F2P56_023709 [Juglans regia]|uniref:Uncharacterized protein n=2 Tax=Juglans regia TaxID=51240 RepID=A0A833UAU3_JUGRE|nr:uncharacterized protein LOC108983822 [Juglans regia]KAF5454008.1 hypothetical protein F2P56_023709 [Juglans regia]
MGPKTRSFGRYYLRSLKLESQQVATRVLHHASSQEPPTINEERRLEELRAQGPVLGNAKGLAIDVNDMDVSLQSGRSSSQASSCDSRRRQREGPFMQVPTEISNCLFAIARSSAARAKLDEVLYGTRKRGKGETSSESVGSQSDGGESDGSFERQSHCVRLLEGITPPLPSEQFNLAWERLLDRAVQMDFLAMSESRRTEWVWSLH